jgi:hypothetical protein
MHKITGLHQMVGQRETGPSESFAFMALMDRSITDLWTHMGMIKDKEYLSFTNE